MAVARVSYNTAQTISNVRSLAVAPRATASAGNLLVSAVAINKTAGSTPAPSTGWTLVDGRASTSITLAMAYRIADGGANDTCTWSWTNAQNVIAWIAEYSGYAAGLITPIPQVANYTNESNVTSVALASASSAGDAVCLALVAADTWTGWGSGARWSDSFAEVAANVATDGIATDVGGSLAELIVTAAGTRSTTATAAGGAGDQASGLLAVFGVGAAEVTVRTIWCGGVTTTAAEVVVTVDRGTRGRLVVSTSRDLSTPTYSTEQTVDAQLVLRLPITGLTADTTYYYGIEIDRTLLAGSGRGSFRTMASTAATFSFAVGSCWHPSFGTSPAFSRLLSAGARFLIEDGDLGYPDEASSLSVAGLRTSYDTVQRDTNIARVLAAMPVVHAWDDHDSGGDGAYSGSANIGNAQQVYREREAHYTLDSATGIYQTWTCGRCRFVLLDCRSFRDIESATDNSSKTMLGTAQKTWLDGVLRAAAEKVIFIVSSVPWNDPRSTTGDGWGRYTTERDSLLAAWASAGVLRRLYMISGDAHMVAADDGTNSPGGIPAVHAAPLGHGTGSIKGGTFSQGTIGGTQQYGFVTVTDAGGSSIRVDFAGHGDDDRTAVSMSTVFDATDPTPSRSRLLLLGVG